MDEHQTIQPDYGMGQKNLIVYVIGFIICSILTLLSFYAVMSGNFARWQAFTIIYSSACIQFIVQIICFIRLNTKTEQGRTNVMSLLFTGVILFSIVVGSLWIMWSLNYSMMH